MTRITNSLAVSLAIVKASRFLARKTKQTRFTMLRLVCTSYKLQPSTSSFVWQQILGQLISVTWWMCLWRIRMSCLLDLHLRMCVWEGLLTIWVERPFLRISTIHCRSVSWSRWLLYKSWLSLFAIVNQVWICMHIYRYIWRETYLLTDRWMDRF